MKSILYTLLLLCPYFLDAQTTQIRVPVSSGDDDIEMSTAFYATSSDLELGGFDSSNNGAQYVALRFANVALPTNAQISKAYIQFTTKAANTQTASVSIKCQKGNAAAYLSTENLLLRTYVTPNITWNPLAWTLANESGVKQQTASLTAQVQAAIATGWLTGNALSFVLQGNATVNDVLNARSYENNATHAGAPELVIEYSTTINPCSPDVIPPVFVGCPPNISLTTTGTTAVATWTAPTVIDNCTTNITPSVTSSPTAGLTRGSAFPIGTTAITYNAKDATNLNAIPCAFTVTVAATAGGTTLRVPIAIGSDDIEVGAAQTYGSSSDLDVGGFDVNIGGSQYVAIRFQNVSLPTNAQISKAYIQFTSKAASTQTAVIAIKCQQGNAAAYNPTTENLLLRTYVAPTITWNPTAWTVADVAGVAQQTANLSAQIQAAITTTWTSGNALSFILQGNATVDNIINARSYETLATHEGAAELVIEYTTGTNPCSPDIIPPVITACPTNINLTTTGTTAVATWTAPTVTDNCTPNITPSVISSPTAGLTRGSAFPIGTTTITYNAKDAANLNAVPCVFTVTVSATTGTTTLRVPVIDGNDDVEVSTQFSATSSDLELGGFDSFNAGAQYVAIRFQNVALPANAQISKAYIQFTTKSPNTLTANLTIKSQKGNAAAYLATENLLSRVYATPTVTWNPTAWTIQDEAGVNQRSADLSAAIAASIATGWVSGNALSFVLQGNATVDNILNARSYENNATHAGAPELVIEYTIGVNPCTNDVVAPVFAACPANITMITSGTTAVVTWTAPTVTDNCTPNITPSVISSPTAGLTSGSSFPLGTTTMTYNAKDAANNNASPCTFTVVVTTGTPPPTLFINEVAPQGTIAITSDWIELYNNATTTAVLTDVYITNKVATPFKFSLAGLTIPAKGFLLLYADNLPLLGNTHLNFKVSAGGEKLYLNRNVNGTAVQLAFFETPAMPFEEDNVTVGGLTEGAATPAPAALTKFLGGTPNAANAGGLRYGRVASSLPRGILTAAATTTLTAPAGMTIRYTTNNSLPTRTNGTIYSQPINITTTRVIKTFAYSANSESKIEAFTYIFPIKGPELIFPNLVTAADYESGMKYLPIISVSSHITPVSDINTKLVSFEYIKKFGETGSVAALCGIRAYGNSSLDDIKNNLRLSFKNEYGFGNLEYPIFKRDDVDTTNAFTPTTKFDVLDLKIGQDGPSSNGYGMMMTSQGLVGKTMREMGNIDLHTQYVHAFVNGVYHGIYILKEHFDDNFGETYYGGNKDLYDNIENPWDVGAINLDSDGNPKGNLTNWNALRTGAQQNNFQTVKSLMNVKQYIDMMLTIMYFDNEWEFRAVADQALVATKFVFENHDTDGAMTKTIGDITPFNYDQKWQITDPAYSEIFKGPGGIFGNLYNAPTRNLEFKTMVRDRVYEAFQKPNGALTPNRIITKLNELRTGVRPAWNMEWARFNQTFYNNYDQEFADNLPNVPDRFQYNLDKWLERGLKHTLLPVIFSQPNGTVTTPVLVTNPSNKGVVYYMLDGTDPMGNDGVIKPTAKLYTNQLSLNAGVNNVVARVYFNAEWGPKATATYTSAVAVLAAQVSQIFSANARLDGQKAVVSWISKTSVAADYFMVEKRNALGVFETMKTVNAQGVSQPDVLENYSWTDENLVEGDNVYRVALTSTALKTPQYSSNIKVKFIPADVYSIFPNPTAQFFDVDLSTVEGKMVSISVFNTMGVAVLNKKIEKAARTERIHIENLTPAQYQVVIQPQGKRVVMKKVSVVRM